MSEDPTTALLMEALPYIGDPDHGTAKEAKALAERLAACDDELAKRAAPFVADSEHGTYEEADALLDAIRRRLGQAPRVVRPAVRSNVSGSYNLWYCWCTKDGPIAQADRPTDPTALATADAHKRGEHKHSRDRRAPASEATITPAKKKGRK